MQRRNTSNRKCCEEKGERLLGPGRRQRSSCLNRRDPVIPQTCRRDVSLSKGELSVFFGKAGRTRFYPFSAALHRPPSLSVPTPALANPAPSGSVRWGRERARALSNVTKLCRSARPPLTAPELGPASLPDRPGAPDTAPSGAEICQPQMRGAGFALRSGPAPRARGSLSTSLSLSAQWGSARGRAAGRAGTRLSRSFRERLPSSGPRGAPPAPAALRHHPLPRVSHLPGRRGAGRQRPLLCPPLLARRAPPARPRSTRGQAE